MKQPAAVLDIGSSKVVCLIGDCKRDGQVELYGAGIYEYRGMKKRSFIDEQSLLSAVHNAIEQAQLEARRKVRSVFVGVPGQMADVVCKSAGIDIERSDNRVTEQDVENVVRASLDFFRPDDRELIHSMPVRFKTDETRSGGVPIGVAAGTLSAQVSHVLMSSDYRRLIDSALEVIDVEASMYIYSPMAEGHFVIESDKRGRLSVLVDMGYYSTDVDVFLNDAVVSHTSLEVGGAHFASDLTLGLEIEPQAAESIKRRHVFGLDYEGSVLEGVRMVDGRAESMEYDHIRYVLDARAAESASLIGNIIYESGFKVPRTSFVYLMGGGLAMMRGGRELLQSALGMQVRVKTPWMPRLNSPNYASAFGLMNYVYNGVSDTGENLMGRQAGDILDKLIHFFTK